MWATYSTYFTVALWVYCVVSLAFLKRPLILAVSFIAFRSIFAVAGYLQFGAIGGLPYFLPPTIILMAGAVIAFFSRMKSLDFPNPIRIGFLFLILVFISTLVDSFLNTGTITGFITYLMKQLAVIPVYICVLASIRRPEDLSKCARYLCYATMIPVLVGLYQAATGHSYDYITDQVKEGIRPVGTIIDANSYGMFISFALIAMIPEILRKKSLRIFIFSFALLAVDLVLSKNRGSWIAIALAFSVSIPIFSTRVKVGKWIAAGAVIVLLASPIVIARFQELHTVDKFGQSQDTLSERLAQSEKLIARGGDSVLTGYGPGSGEMPWTQGDTPRPPHNDYVRIFYEFGLPALILYVWALGSQTLFNVSRRKYSGWRYQFAGLMAQIYVVVISISQNLLYDTVSYSFYLYILAMCHGATHLEEVLRAGGGSGGTGDRRRAI